MNSQLQTLFDRATEAQSKGKDLEALALYREIKSQGLSSAALELNMAQIHENTEEWGLALNKIENAQFLARNPWLATEQMARIQRKVSMNRAYPSGDTSHIGFEIAKIIRPTESLFLALTFLGIFFLSKALTFKGKINSALIFMFSIFFLISGVSFLGTQSVYLVKEAELRELPILETPAKMKISKGSRVKVIEEKEVFLKVKRSGDFEGWIEKSAIKDPDSSL